MHGARLILVAVIIKNIEINHDIGIKWVKFPDKVLTFPLTLLLIMTLPRSNPVVKCRMA